MIHTFWLVITLTVTLQVSCLEFCGHSHKIFITYSCTDKILDNAYVLASIKPFVFKTANEMPKAYFAIFLQRIIRLCCLRCQHTKKSGKTSNPSPAELRNGCAMELVNIFVISREYLLGPKMNKFPKDCLLLVACVLFCCL
jgi:hypothetical protein